MNVELLKQIRDAIEMVPKTFDQGDWGGENLVSDRQSIDFVRQGKHPYLLLLSCQTPCCIAGHAIAIRKERVSEPFEIIESARVLLGLTLEQTKVLFSGYWNKEWLKNNKEPLSTRYYHTDGKTFQPTAQDAVEVLNTLIEHGWEER